MQSEQVREMPLPFAPARARARGPWLRLLSEVLGLAGPAATFLSHSEREWASATFSGARHVIELSFEGTDAVAQGEALIAALPDHEFTVPHHLVADATVAGVEHRQAPSQLTVSLELLVLEDF